MTTIEVLHNKVKGLITVKINGKHTSQVWPYGDNTFLHEDYMKEAKIAAFNYACEYSFSGGVKVIESCIN